MWVCIWFSLDFYNVYYELVVFASKKKKSILEMTGIPMPNFLAVLSDGNYFNFFKQPNMGTCMCLYFKNAHFWIVIFAS